MKSPLSAINFAIVPASCVLVLASCISFDPPTPLEGTIEWRPNEERRDSVLVVSERNAETGRYEIPKCPKCGKKMINFCVRYQCPEQHISETKEVRLK